MNKKTLIKTTNKRDTTLDIIRIIALFCVISVHFFLNNGFYEEPVFGKKMFAMVIMRTGLMVCVPLFMVLTGYLMRKKVLSKKYYAGLIKTLGIYFLASIMCLIYKDLFLKNSFSIFGALKGLFNFSLANYSWYIEMYIGLYLLIPFLNLIYNNLKTKKEKKLLIFTMLLLTSIPTITNIYNKVLPFWWSSIYPITYYYIGAYLSEYKLKINGILNFVLLFVSVILFGIYNYFCSYGKTFIWGTYQSWGAIQNVIMTVLLFVLIRNIDFNKLPDTIKKIIKHMSDCCLGAYLVSFIFDDAFYRILNDNITEVTDKLIYYIVIVPIIFSCSLVLSAMLNLIYNAVLKIFFYVRKKYLIFMEGLKNENTRYLS